MLNAIEKNLVTSHPVAPIVETPDSVYYLGVRLSKAQKGDAQLVPDREKFADIIDDLFFLRWQRELAVCFLTGDPVLIEGGTSLGKTTAVKKMAAELGWEVHYINLNNRIDPEALMGGHVPNPNKRGAEDPDYIFADGKVTSGLRQEAGKIKIIILDEFNAADSNVIIRLHEVLDALNRGEAVVLTEHASESIPVSKVTTKIVALMNPPGKGYFAREPLDPAQLRRWVYLKAPSELPAETFSYATDALFKLVPPIENVPEAEYLVSQEQILLPEQLQEIPGIVEIVKKYKEFHLAAKKLVENRTVAADQPQPFTFDDREEPRRVRDFVLRFYRGDINETFQAALRYYYSNKLESKDDREKLDELIRHVAYTAPVKTTQRRGPTRISATDEVLSASAEIIQEVNAWRTVLGVEVDVPPLPPTITPEVKKTIERLGFELRYIPELDLGKSEALETKGAESFLMDLQHRYPNWCSYESLSKAQKVDCSIPRNLEVWFWNLVKEGKVNFPKLDGAWIAVENVEKPEVGNQYADTDAMNVMQLRDYFNVPATRAEAALKGPFIRWFTQKTGLNLHSSAVRLLTAVEWNLLGNREGWGKTSAYEWTSDVASTPSGFRRIIVGGYGSGGAANASWTSPESVESTIGFRAAVVLGK